VKDAAIDRARVEEAGLNAVQTQRQLFYDGWLLRLSPGKAKRGRSVQPHFGSSLPIEAKIAHCEDAYAARTLPALFRITPFCRPATLDGALARRGYVAFDPTLVQVASLAAPGRPARVPDIELASVSPGEFADAVAALRGSSATERAAHRERLAHTPLAAHALVARDSGRVVACGQTLLEDSLAGIYDMATIATMRGRGFATAIVAALFEWAREHGARHAYLQVNDDNVPARALYRRFGFATAYTYHYRARPDECR
jgi:N-acetylglutamate synthase